MNLYEATKADLEVATRRVIELEHELSDASMAWSERGIAEKDCRLPLAERIDNFLLEYKDLRSDWAKEQARADAAESKLKAASEVLAKLPAHKFKERGEMAGCRTCARCRVKLDDDRVCRICRNEEIVSSMEAALSTGDSGVRG